MDAATTLLDNAADAPAFPASEDALRKLINQHISEDDQKLLLAVYYAPARDAGDVFLFEVFENFGANRCDEEKKIFEITYTSSGFPLAPGRALHMLLTNLPELHAAVEEGWSVIQELRQANESGSAKVLYSDPAQAELWGMICGLS